MLAAWRGTRQAHPNLGSMVVTTCFGSALAHIAAMASAPVDLGAQRQSGDNTRLRGHRAIDHPTPPRPRLAEQACSRVSAGLVTNRRQPRELPPGQAPYQERTPPVRLPPRYDGRFLRCDARGGEGLVAAQP